MALIGAGLIADAIARTDSGPRRGDPAEPATAAASGQVVVVASDCWDMNAYPAVREAGRVSGGPWLPVRAELGRVVIGPVEVAGRPGCVQCAEARRQRAREHPEGYDAVRTRHAEALAQRPTELLTVLAAELIAGLVADEVARLTRDVSAARTHCAMLYVDLRTLQVTTHRFLPDPLCPECGGLPTDDAESARIVLRSRPKPTPDTYRVRAVMDELDALRQTYVDAECGVVRVIRRDSSAGLAVAAAPMGLRGGQVESGFGRTRSYLASETIALLEALERYAGMQPGGKRTAVRASYTELRAQAIDPRTLGLHATDSYQSPDFRYRPFDENAPYRWVWGYSFVREAPVLVPEAYAYYGTHDHDTFVYEISNGCALGSCLEEAILYGVLEIAERDAFLMTWYARMPVPRIDPSSARDRAIPTLVETIEAETGYLVHIFDITLEQGIPCFWVMAVNPSESDGQLKVVCAAGSHLDPERAVENALSELGPILASHIATLPHERRRAREMVADPSRVEAMADHTIANGDITAYHRFDFLTESTRVRSFADIARSDGHRNTDLCDDLRSTIDRYRTTGLDVIVVDQTTPEHRAGGLSCVKVIIPGTLPMTFGHQFRRVDGLPRLYDVPRLLGFRSDRLAPEDVNPHPHPFP
ncbi:TOMM precursor leader peptide-binding protein [Dactylosporangium sp. NPDC051541]|uniref:TOMM precursor leader peptide-binding protein n=1 Tax=Dactylosporangium sp. NPDC051541 TaxID=3363977 RepID=UPI0037A49437